MSGRLGSWELYANLNQAVYVCDKDQATQVVVNVCNRNNVPALIRIAVSASATTPANADYIEYDVELGPKGVLERTAVTVSPGQYIVVRSSVNAVNVVCWGPTVGEEYPATPISTAPNWYTTSPITLYAGTTADVQLIAPDPKGNSVTYSLAVGSTLPSGASLSSTGLISGTVGTAGYDTNGVTTTATINSSNGTSTTPRTFSIIRRWKDGLSVANAAPSADAIKTLTGTSTNGLYWIQPSTDIAAQQVYCIMDNSIGDSGGWMMAFNLLGDNINGLPGGSAGWYNTAFWDSKVPVINGNRDMLTNQKTVVYGYAPVTKLNFVLHNTSNTSFRGWGAYTLTGSAIGQSLFNLCSIGADDRTVSGSRTYTGGTGSGAVANPLRSQTANGDLFVDSQNAAYGLKFRSNAQWSSDGGTANNRMRISTTRGDGNTLYGHTFGGIGGTHMHSGWSVDFAFAPVTSYCDNPQVYGTRESGLNYTQKFGYSYPASPSCSNAASGGLGVIPCAMGVYVK